MASEINQVLMRITVLFISFRGFGWKYIYVCNACNVTKVAKTWCSFVWHIISRDTDLTHKIQHKNDVRMTALHCVTSAVWRSPRVLLFFSRPLFFRALEMSFCWPTELLFMLDGKFLSGERPSDWSCRITSILRPHDGNTMTIKRLWVILKTRV